MNGATRSVVHGRFLHIFFIMLLGAAVRQSSAKRSRK
jgi:hypothetical protein